MASSNQSKGVMDIRQNQETWAAFVKLTVYGSVSVIVALVLMAIFLL